MLLYVLRASLLLGIACGGDAPTPPDTRAEPSTSASYDGTWKLIEGHGPTGDIPIIEAFRITMSINGKALGGTAACNEYGGTAVIEGTKFDMRGGGINQMGCRPDVNKSEQAYIEALVAADAISRDRETLVLTGDETELRFELVPPAPISDLVDIEWKLESLISVNGKDRSASASPSTLLVRSDGTFKATTTCDVLTGKWIESGDEIKLTESRSRGNCSEDEEGSHVMSVIGDGFAPTLRGSRLTLTDRGGLGLVYRPAK